MNWGKGKQHKKKRKENGPVYKEDWTAKRTREKMAAAQRRWRRAGLLRTRPLLGGDGSFQGRDIVRIETRSDWVWLDSDVWNSHLSKSQKSVQVKKLRLGVGSLFLFLFFNLCLPSRFAGLQNHYQLNWNPKLTTSRITLLFNKFPSRDRLVNTAVFLFFHLQNTIFFFFLGGVTIPSGLD